MRKRIGSVAMVLDSTINIIATTNVHCTIDGIVMLMIVAGVVWCGVVCCGAMQRNGGSLCCHLSCCHIDPTFHNEEGHQPTQRRCRRHDPRSCAGTLWCSHTRSSMTARQASLHHIAQHYMTMLDMWSRSMPSSHEPAQCPTTASNEWW
jgi:hypothetical protein